MRVIASIVFLLFSCVVKAESNVVCNSCSTQLEALKFSSLILKPMGKFEGKINVGNIQEGKFFAFNVGYELGEEDEFGNDPVREFVIRSTYVSSTAKHEFEKLAKSEFYLKANSVIEVPIDSGYDSAWEIARSSSARNGLDEWFNSNHPVNYWTNSILSAYGGLIIGPLSGLEITFKFSDGSTLIMKAAQLHSTSLKFSYVSGSAEYKDNSIPDAGTSFGGTYEFQSYEDIRTFLDRAIEYGIEINGGGVPSCEKLGCRITIVTSD